MAGGQNTFVAGNVLTAAQINTYLMDQAIMKVTSGTKPTAAAQGGGLLEGMAIYETDTNLTKVYNGTSWVVVARDAWATFTPTCTQSGAVTLTTATGRYSHIGTTCTLHVALDFGGTGGGATTIAVDSIPAAIAPRSSGSPVGSTADVPLGSFVYYDSGSALYSGTCFFASSSTISFVEANTISGSFLGGAPAITIAAADSLSLTITYETSSAAVA